MSIRAFSPDGAVTFESCPVCQELDVKAEHGEEVEIIDGVAHSTGIEQRLWHCPVCGDSIAMVIRVGDKK